MEQISEKLRSIPLEHVKAHPEIITDLLSTEDNLSVVLEKHGNTVRLAAMRVYDKDATRILQEARREYLQKKEKGYSREQAFADLEAVQEEIQGR